MKPRLLLFSIVLLGFQMQAQTLVKDIVPGVSGSNPTVLGSVNGKLFFFANDISKGRELFVSDGTSNGTYLVKDIAQQGSSIQTETYRLVDTLLFFFAKSSISNSFFSLYASNGTEAGTVKLMDLISSTTPSMTKFEMSDVNGKFLFVNQTETGREIWVSDGTETGTRMLKDINSSSSGCEPLNLTQAGKRVFFYANDNEHGQELWATDGTESGTYLVRDIFSGPVSSLFSVSTGPGMHAFGDKVMFSAIEDLKIGYELFISDGTDTGTYMVKDIYTGDYHHSNPMVFVSCDQFALMYATNQVGHTSIFRSDGTDAGTFLVFEDTASSLIKSTFVYTLNLGKYALFSQFYSGLGNELWTSDGTASGTHVLIDLFPGPSGGFNGIICRYKDLAFFSGQNPQFGRELWYSDGTQDNSRLYADLNQGTSSSGLFSLCVMDNYLYSDMFINAMLGTELYKLDLNNFQVSVKPVHDASIQVYPNPIRSHQKLNLPEGTEHCRIYDLQGRLVFDEHVTSDSIELPGNLSTGTYWVSIRGQGGDRHLMLIVEP